MDTIRIATQTDECRAIWEEVSPGETIWDLWEVRDCFHRHFRRPLHFIVAEKEGRVRGLLPLAWIEECRFYGYFPGETWKGTTWLEQNRLFGDGDSTRAELLNYSPEDYHLRYLLPSGTAGGDGWATDEIGYLFHPPRYNYEIERYFDEFSRKSRKRLKRDLSSFAALGASYRYDDNRDFEDLVALNLNRFGNSSYFADPRFTESFRDLMNLLRERGWLRITTVLIRGKIAAVDLGCVFKGVYTLLAGGTDGDFPGAAKFINTHHMAWACERKLEEVDFLCGDFAWKTIFHLSPRPLYLLSTIADKAAGQPGGEITGRKEDAG